MNNGWRKFPLGIDMAEKSVYKHFHEISLSDHVKKMCIFRSGLKFSSIEEVLSSRTSNRLTKPQKSNRVLDESLESSSLKMTSKTFTIQVYILMASLEMKLFWLTGGWRISKGLIATRRVNRVTGKNLLQAWLTPQVTVTFWQSLTHFSLLQIPTCITFSRQNAQGGSHTISIASSFFWRLLLVLWTHYTDCIT